MSLTPPFRGAKSVAGSPTIIDTSLTEPDQSSLMSTSTGTTDFSPLRSTALPGQGAQGRYARNRRRQKWSFYARYAKQRLQALLTSKFVWTASLLVGLIWWWGNAITAKADSAGPSSAATDTKVSVLDLIRNLQFFPASNPKIHVSPAPGI